jgi:bifunctional non-homologous end joining protein LigD
VGLEVYRKKRKFDATPEPRGREVRRKGNAFVIQKHAARRLHYDLRLELDGVMKSWAVTRGPSLVPGEKRLAVHVEDHPIEYNKFEGTIPEGQYGGGAVMVWDRGTWTPEGDPHKGLKKGHLTFRLDGKKLNGLWHLIRMRGRPNEKKENWLLIKAHDEAARSPRDPDILEEESLSVVSGRSIQEIAEGTGGKRVWQSNRSGASAKPAKAAAANAAATSQRKSARSPRRAATSKTKSKSKAKAKSRGAPLPDFVPPALEAKKAMAKTSSRAKTGKRAAESSGNKSSSNASPASKTKAGNKPTGKPWKEGDVRFTHPDRVYWVDVGVTKQDLADFYRQVWDWMAPHVVDRPLALVRCPEGTKGQCFFQKHASAGLEDERLRTVIDPNHRQVIAIDDIDGLLSLVQAGVLEVHVRGSKIDRLDLCDRVVFDLDPGEGIGWSDIVTAARDVRERLAAIGLESFVKLSGGKGLHVVMPLVATDWDTTKVFVQAFAQAMAVDGPERYVATMKKSLREGRIFVDYLRNSLEQTSVAAYSTRARPGAPVSVPVTWQELGRTTGGNQYTVLNLMKRLGGLRQDPWRDMTRIKQKLPDLQTLRKLA